MSLNCQNFFRKIWDEHLCADNEHSFEPGLKNSKNQNLDFKMCELILCTSSREYITGNDGNVIRYMVQMKLNLYVYRGSQLWINPPGVCVI